MNLRLAPVALAASLFVAPLAAAAEDSVAAAADQVQPILIGATAPDSRITSLDGSETTLHDVVLGKKSILIFYRGGW